MSESTEFERAIPLGPRVCDVCDTFLEDAARYWALELSRMVLVPDDDGELEPVPRISYELQKHCSIECGNDPVNDYLDARRISDIDPPHDPVSSCAVCGVPVLRLAEHSCLVSACYKDDHVVDAQILAVLCDSCHEIPDDDDGDDDPDGEPVVPMPVLLAAGTATCANCRQGVSS